MFDDQFLATIEEPGFRAWSSDEQAAILAHRQTATNQFAQGEYALAVSTLASASSRAETGIADWNAAFADILGEAEIALADDAYDAALAAITTAETYRPGDPVVTGLATRIEALPAILEALEEVRVANIEGNLESELAGIKTVMSLDPQRTELAQRQSEIEATLRERRFARAIAAGLADVDQENLDGAIQQLHVGRSIYPARDEITLLSTKIERLQRTLDVRSFIAHADRHAEADDWQVAAGFYRQALLLDPDSKTAQQGRDLSTDIAGLQGQLDTTIAAPYRLSSSSVSKQAQEMLLRARVMSAFSPRLRSSTEELSQLIEVYDQPIDVEVVSDGETYVSVRGVGKVGQTTRRTISLKPGRYSFEGIRQGYVSKLIEVEVPPGGQMVSVTVICDELI